MTGDSQDQRVGSGGQAVQAGRDVIIHKGMSPEDMAKMMMEMSKQLAAFTDDAKQMVEARLREFQEDILKAFVGSKKNTNAEAWRDPDFQYLLAESQKSYVRSGDAAVRGTLVDIIARRSLETERSRMAITLDDAAIRAPALTANEFSALSLVYIVKYTVDNRINTFKDFCNYIQTHLMPFVANISKERSSYWHIESQGCGSVESLAEVDLFSVLRSQYAGVLGKGFTRETLEAHLPDGKKDLVDKFIIQCLQDPEKLQPVAIRREVFIEKTREAGIERGVAENVWNPFENTVPPENDVVKQIESHVSGVQNLFDVWRDTLIKRLTLNSVGLAIGHANAVRVMNFDAPLEIWIK